MAKVETERYFGKKGIIIMIRDGSKLVSAIFKDKKNADKFNRNKPADVKKLLQLAKKTKYPKGIDEDTDVGHQDDEPNMLKSTTLEIMEYGKKLTDMLDKYDDMDGEVDFPNWWQKKLILARDYVSAAYHYLDSEEKTSENMDRNFRSYDDEEEVEEGFASNAQRKAAFASGYKAKGKKGKKKNESIDEAYIVLYSPKKGVKPVTTAAYKDKKDAQKWAKDLGGITMIVKRKVKGIDESASKLAMGIAGFTGTRGVAVDDFIQKHKIDAKKLFNFVKKGNLKDRMTFVAAIAGRPNNKMFKMITKQFGESVNERINPKFYDARVQYIDPKSKKKFVGDVVRYDNGEYKVNLGKDGRFEKYILAKEKDLKIVSKSKKKTFESVNEDAPCWDTHKQVGMKMKGGKQVPNCVPKNEIKEDKNQIVQLKKKVGKSEIKFYDALSKIEKKLGKKNYRAFLEKGLSDFKINPKHYDYRGNGAAEEKLFQLAKW